MIFFETNPTYLRAQPHPHAFASESKRRNQAHEGKLLMTTLLPRHQPVAEEEQQDSVHSCKKTLGSDGGTNSQKSKLRISFIL
jgi:hypothetical protein